MKQKRPADLDWGDFDIAGAMREIHKPRVPQGWDEPLYVTPHYSNPAFQRSAVTVWGKEADDLFYNHDDRLWQADYTKHQAAVKTANESGAKPKTARWYQTYLSAYFGKPLQLGHVMAGVNKSNGFPYVVFGYREKPTEEKASEGSAKV